ncbi:hypothetical protein [Flavobacterium sp.]|uniref:hypothetical protein n=1 Tax=Flavobacterium sp. TaxID=239 RepID=UPI00286CB2E2|nr:hypothetical protein [Flavobacterium sp.]
MKAQIYDPYYKNKKPLKKIIMPRPEDVNPQAFTVIDVLYNHDDFAISYGVWNETGDSCLAMRWNNADDGNGYPKVFAHPQWFIISNDIARNILTGILNNPIVTNLEYSRILTALTIL